ncbi:MAG TPA: hypothetical protein VEQ85_08420, partial [Lacipirellulaceae bacterium]|nr:hypothetical protein [Lacipirellulaceae bacterium]
MKASTGNVARSVSRRQLLLGAAAAAATSGWRHLGRAAPAARHDEADSAAARSALAAAAQYLWRMQDADGRWHSPQYGVLRSGQALTPFVLDALLAVPEAAAPRDGVPRALEFIRRHVANGRLGHFDPDVLEYPVYSTAYAIRCLASAGVASDQSLAEKLRTFLANAQYGPDHGIGAENPALGAWGFDAPPGDGRAGHLDLAHTRRALQALRCGDRRWGVVARDRSEVEARAQAFLRVVQKHPEATAHPRFPEGARPLAPPPYDGGIYYSPTAIDANKGGWGGGGAPHWRSYATATCDGILALLAAGVPR